MFDRYDSHDRTEVVNVRSGPDGATVLVGGAVVAAAAIGMAMALAAIAAMIWAIVCGVLGVAAIWGTVQIYQAKKHTEIALARAAVDIAAMQRDGLVPVITSAARPVIDAGLAPRPALPPGQVELNGRPYVTAAAASAARRR